MRNHRYILSYGLLIAALAYTLWFVFAGFGNHQDPLYWLYKYEHLQGGWMATGTLLTGGLFVRLFGARLLVLRLVGWLCVVSAIAIPYCCLLTKEQRRNNLHWLALTYVLMGYGAFQEFSPGTLSVLLLSLLWVTASTSNIKHHTSYITAILLGIAVSVRFPNILALLVMVFVWKKRSMWNIPITALTAGLVYLLGYLFITPAAADAAMSSHELLPMFTKLWENGGKLVGYMLLGIGVLAIGRFSNLRFQISNFKLQIFSAVAAGAALVYFVWFTMRPLQWYNIDLTYLISALILMISLSPNPLTPNRSPLILGAIILMIATLGTDTAWLKLFPAVLCLLPVAATGYTPQMKRYLFIVLAVLSIVVVTRMTTNSVGQSNLTKVQSISTIAPYQGIAIRNAEQTRLEQYIADFDSLSNVQYPMSNILSMGQENHLMRAVTGCEAARFNEFWSNIYDSVYTAKYREIIRAEQPIVFCSFSPQFKTKPEYKDKESRMEQMLLEEGYQPIDRSKYRYMIYVK